TFGGYSGIKITAKIPKEAKPERTLNLLTGDSVITWRALKIPVEIEWVGEYIRPVSKEDLPFELTKKEEFPQCQENKPENLNKSYNLGSEIFCPIYGDINNDGIKEAIFLGNNRLYAVDSNGVPLKNFPVLLSNGEPFTNFRSKPIAIDIDGNDSLEILIPANNGLILAVNGEGKLLKKEFPVAAGVFTYDTVPHPMRLLNKENYLFVLHRDSVKAFYLPKAKRFIESTPKSPQYRDEISEFFIYPNPIRTGKAAMRFRIENNASSATLDIFDITGFKVFSRSISNVNYGSNQIDGLDLSNLGSDVYSARLTVKFDKTKKEKWMRVGVIR
ncbi:MAG: T9SS type A sorting domain-containing protein, partial [Candidatus Fibromonas sp.]|nr:T9SS type A sorting domain-containing protein [Candidatus Fibromonas sp.]